MHSSGLAKPRNGGAGVSQMHKSKLEDTDPQVLKDVLDTNLLGSIFGARAALQVVFHTLSFPRATFCALESMISGPTGMLVTHRSPWMGWTEIWTM